MNYYNVAVSNAPRADISITQKSWIIIVIMNISNKTKDYKIIPWNTETVYALGFYRTLTRTLGIWPLDQKDTLSLVQVTTNSTLQFIIIIIFIYKLFTIGNCSIITDIVDALSLVGTSILSITKMVLPHIHKEKLFLIVNSAVRDWADIGDSKSRKIMLKYAMIGRVVFMVQMIGAYIPMILLIFSNLPNLSTVNTDSINISEISYRNIPVGPNCWISPTMPLQLYLLLYCLLIIHLIIVSTATIGGDVYIFGIAMHMCGQFEILYHKMEKLDGSDNYLTLRAKINQNSHRHNILLDRSNKLEESFSLIILLQVIANTFLVGISSILLLWALNAGDSEIIIGSLVRIYLLYCQLYIYSYIGESLSHQSEKLQVAIYNSKWYEMSPQLVRDLVFIMMRNNYPFHLTAGKIINMNISSFKDLVKTMFSYFSIMRLMFDTNGD